MPINRGRNKRIFMCNQGNSDLIVSCCTSSLAFRSVRLHAHSEPSLHLPTRIRQLWHFFGIWDLDFGIFCPYLLLFETNL